MPVNTTALRQIVDGNAWAEGQTAIVTASAEGRDIILGAVVDGVGVGRVRGRRRRGVGIVRTAANGLMIYAGRLAGVLAIW